MLDTAVAVYRNEPALAVSGAAGRKFVGAFIALDADVGRDPPDLEGNSGGDGGDDEQDRFDQGVEGAGELALLFPVRRSLLSWLSERM